MDKVKEYMSEKGNGRCSGGEREGLNKQGWES